MILIALKDVRHDIVSTMLNLITIGILIFAFLLLISLSFTLNQFGEDQGPTNNLLIIERDVLSPEQSELPVALGQTVFQVLGEQVARSDPLIFRIMKVEDLTIQLRGISPSAWTSTFHLELIDGEWPTSQGEILVDRIIAENPGWNLGSQVTIYGRTFKVAGLTEGAGSTTQTVWLPFTTARALFDQFETSELIVVNLKSGTDPLQARQDLQARLQTMGDYDVYFENALLRRFGAAFRDLRSLSVLLTGIAIIAVTLGSHNQAWLATEQRKPNLGILRTIGFHRPAVEAYLLSRALIINLIAYLLAYFAASVFVHGTALEIFSFGGTRLSLELAPSVALAGLLLSSVSTLLGTWLSSRKTMTSTPATLLGQGRGASLG
jgi:ABC-type antimicrobial peptide transport system permease subunit